MHFNNRNRKAEYKRLQREAAGSEVVTELKPGTVEDDVTEGTD